MDVRSFDVDLTAFRRVREIPGAWPAARLLALLALLEVDGVSEDEADEMALLALQDLQPDDAAERVLEVVFGEGMRRGVRQNLAHDMTEDRPWEGFPELHQQAGIFNAATLLHRAFPHDVGRPEAAAIAIRVTTSSDQGGRWLDALRPDPALLLRLLAAGMDDRAVLHRLFGDALRARSFPEAPAILWHVSRIAGVPTREFELISDPAWLEPLRGRGSWTVKARPDARDAD